MGAAKQCNNRCLKRLHILALLQTTEQNLSTGDCVPTSTYVVHAQKVVDEVVDALREVRFYGKLGCSKPRIRYSAMHVWRGEHNMPAKGRVPIRKAASPASRGTTTPSLPDRRASSSKCPRARWRRSGSHQACRTLCCVREVSVGCSLVVSPAAEGKPRHCSRMFAATSSMSPSSIDSG